MKTKKEINCLASDRKATCSSCDGRFHNLRCTATLNSQIDCCPARHKMLYEQGELKGRSDSSLDMWDKETDTFEPRKFWIKKKIK